MIEGLIGIAGVVVGAILGAWIDWKGRSYKSPIPFSKDTGIRVHSLDDYLTEDRNVSEH